MNPHDYCRERAARSGSSFYYSFVFLPAPKRRAITAFYALCRELDDTVDETSDPGVAAVRLAWWRTEIGRFAAGVPEHPVTRALLDSAPGLTTSTPLLDAIVDGMAMDLQPTHYPDFAALDVYCHRVAGVVGEVAARLFADAPLDEATRAYAHKLGRAFQLTNILRDVGEDARRGRVYLPADELARYGVTPQSLLRREYSPAFKAMMDFQAARALDYYRDADALLPRSARRAQRPGLAMAAIYRALLLEIRAADYPVLNARVSLTPLRKLWLASRAWIAA
jgi:phytoene synthase